MKIFKKVVGVSKNLSLGVQKQTIFIFTKYEMPGGNSCIQALLFYLNSLLSIKLNKNHLIGTFISAGAEFPVLISGLNRPQGCGERKPPLTSS